MSDNGKHGPVPPATNPDPPQGRSPDLLERVAGVVGDLFQNPDRPGAGNSTADLHVGGEWSRQRSEESCVSEVDELRQMMHDFNQKIIEEFRANDGVVGGPFEGAPMLILHTTGARSGQPRVSPLTYRLDDDRLVVFASKGGAPTHPDWYHNLVANPRASVEAGTDTFEVSARVAEGDERERLWTLQKAERPAFGDYEGKTDRQIPVVILERVG